MIKHSVIIADDEALVRERIADLLEPYNKIEIVANCEDGESVVQALEKLKPEILFIDIKMPKADGFEVIERTKHLKMLIVFVTAFDKYALKAFEFAAYDYLVKPINPDRFSKTMKRIFERLGEQKPSIEKALNIKVNGVIRNIDRIQISHIEAADNYVKIFINAEIIKRRSTLKKMIHEINNPNFVQVHRSFVVNTTHIHDMVHIAQGDYLIRLSNGRVVPTSRSFRKNVKELYR